MVNRFYKYPRTVMMLTVREGYVTSQTKAMNGLAQGEGGGKGKRGRVGTFSSLRDVQFLMICALRQNRCVLNCFLQLTLDRWL